MPWNDTAEEDNDELKEDTASLIETLFATDGENFQDALLNKDNRAMIYRIEKDTGKNLTSDYFSSQEILSRWYNDFLEEGKYDKYKELDVSDKEIRKKTIDTLHDWDNYMMDRDPEDPAGVGIVLDKEKRTDENLKFLQSVRRTIRAQTLDVTADFWNKYASEYQKQMASNWLGNIDNAYKEVVDAINSGKFSAKSSFSSFLMHNENLMPSFRELYDIEAKRERSEDILTKTWKTIWGNITAMDDEIASTSGWKKADVFAERLLHATAWSIFSLINMGMDWLSGVGQIAMDKTADSWIFFWLKTWVFNELVWDIEFERRINNSSTWYWKTFNNLSYWTMTLLENAPELATMIYSPAGWSKVATWASKVWKFLIGWSKLGKMAKSTQTGAKALAGISKIIRKGNQFDDAAVGVLENTGALLTSLQRKTKYMSDFWKKYVKAMPRMFWENARAMALMWNEYSTEDILLDTLFFDPLIEGFGVAREIKGEITEDTLRALNKTTEWLILDKKWGEAALEYLGKIGGEDLMVSENLKQGSINVATLIKQWELSAGANDFAKWFKKEFDEMMGQVIKNSDKTLTKKQLENARKTVVADIFKKKTIETMGRIYEQSAAATKRLLGEIEKSNIPDNVAHATIDTVLHRLKGLMWGEEHTMTWLKSMHLSDKIAWVEKLMIDWAADSKTKLDNLKIFGESIDYDRELIDSIVNLKEAKDSLALIPAVTEMKLRIKETKVEVAKMKKGNINDRYTSNIKEAEETIKNMEKFVKDVFYNGGTTLKDMSEYLDTLVKSKEDKKLFWNHIKKLLWVEESGGKEFASDMNDYRYGTSGGVKKNVWDLIAEERNRLRKIQERTIADGKELWKAIPDEEAMKKTIEAWVQKFKDKYMIAWLKDTDEVWTMSGKIVGTDADATYRRLWYEMWRMDDVKVPSTTDWKKIFLAAKLVESGGRTLDRLGLKMDAFYNWFVSEIKKGMSADEIKRIARGFALSEDYKHIVFEQWKKAKNFATDIGKEQIKIQEGIIKKLINSADDTNVNWLIQDMWKSLEIEGVNAKQVLNERILWMKTKLKVSDSVKGMRDKAMKKLTKNAEKYNHIRKNSDLSQVAKKDYDKKIKELHEAIDLKDWKNAIKRIPTKDVVMNPSEMMMLWNSIRDTAPLMWKWLIRWSILEWAIQKMTSAEAFGDITKEITKKEVTDIFLDTIYSTSKEMQPWTMEATVKEATKWLVEDVMKTNVKPKEALKRLKEAVENAQMSQAFDKVFEVKKTAALVVEAGKQKFNKILQNPGYKNTLWDIIFLWWLTRKMATSQDFVKRSPALASVLERFGHAVSVFSNYTTGNNTKTSKMFKHARDRLRDVDLRMINKEGTQIVSGLNVSKVFKVASEEKLAGGLLDIWDGDKVKQEVLDRMVKNIDELNIRVLDKKGNLRKLTKDEYEGVIGMTLHLREMAVAGAEAVWVPNARKWFTWEGESAFIAGNKSAVDIKDGKVLDNVSPGNAADFSSIERTIKTTIWRENIKIAMDWLWSAEEIWKQGLTEFQVKEKIRSLVSSTVTDANEKLADQIYRGLTFGRSKDKTSWLERNYKNWVVQPAAITFSWGKAPMQIAQSFLEHTNTIMLNDNILKGAVSDQLATSIYRDQTAFKEVNEFLSKHFDGVHLHTIDQQQAGMIMNVAEDYHIKGHKGGLQGVMGRIVDFIKQAPEEHTNQLMANLLTTQNLDVFALWQGYDGFKAMMRWVENLDWPAKEVLLWNMKKVIWESTRDLTAKFGVDSWNTLYRNAFANTWQANFMKTWASRQLGRLISDFADPLAAAMWRDGKNLSLKSTAELFKNKEFLEQLWKITAAYKRASQIERNSQGEPTFERMSDMFLTNNPLYVASNMFLWSTLWGEAIKMAQYQKTVWVSAEKIAANYILAWILPQFVNNYFWQAGTAVTGAVNATMYTLQEDNIKMAELLNLAVGQTLKGYITTDKSEVKVGGMKTNTLDVNSVEEEALYTIFMTEDFKGRRSDEWRHIREMNRMAYEKNGSGAWANAFASLLYTAKWVVWFWRTDELKAYQNIIKGSRYEEFINNPKDQWVVDSIMEWNFREWLLNWTIDYKHFKSFLEENSGISGLKMQGNAVDLMGMWNLTWAEAVMAKRVTDNPIWETQIMPLLKSSSKYVADLSELKKDMTNKENKVFRDTAFNTAMELLSKEAGSTIIAWKILLLKKKADLDKSGMTKREQEEIIMSTIIDNADLLGKAMANGDWELPDRELASNLASRFVSSRISGMTKKKFAEGTMQAGWAGYSKISNSGFDQLIKMKVISRTLTQNYGIDPSKFDNMFALASAKVANKIKSDPAKAAEMANIIREYMKVLKSDRWMDKEEKEAAVEGILMGNFQALTAIMETWTGKLLEGMAEKELLELTNMIYNSDTDLAPFYKTKKWWWGRRGGSKRSGRINWLKQKAAKHLGLLSPKPEPAPTRWTPLQNPKYKKVPKPLTKSLPERIKQKQYEDEIKRFAAHTYRTRNLDTWERKEWNKLVSKWRKTKHKPKKVKFDTVKQQRK